MILKVILITAVILAAGYVSDLDTSTRQLEREAGINIVK